MLLRTSLLLLCLAQGVQEDKILEAGDKLLDEAKTAYEEAHSKSVVSAFVDAGFKLEEARIKFIVLQEIGTPERQKLATDRLRAINQLSKLIHDGKVAISGTPAGNPANPAPIPPKKEPGPDAPPEPVRRAVDVMKRAAIPDAAKQRDAEKLIKELFKEQYAKKAPADRLALAEALLQQADKTPDDPAALWVLCREAQDAAAQAGDVRRLTAAIETAARHFDVDAMALKSAAFIGAGKNAKSPQDFGALATALLELTSELVAADLYDPADKAATAAVAHAKKTNDVVLGLRATTVSREVAEAKLKFQAMKSALTTLARTPEDPVANSQMGQFLCFVKGNWDLGLRFIAKGSDAALKSIADKELSFPPKAADRVFLADAWFDLAEKEKSPLGKRQLTAHAREIYEGALPELTGLVRAKVEKRLDAMQQAATVPVGPGGEDLLKGIDPSRDALNGTFKMQDGILIADGASATRHIRLDIRALPAEYDLTAVVEREGSTPGDCFFVLKGGDRAFCFSLDSFYGAVSGIYNIDGKNPRESGTAIKVAFFKTGVSRTVVMQVRKNSFTVLADGKPFYSYTDPWSRLSVHPSFKGDTGKLGIGSLSATYKFKRLSLVTITR